MFLPTMRPPATPIYLCEEHYSQRPLLDDDTRRGVRYRVAIQIYRRLWAVRPHRQSKARFLAWFVKSLDKRVQARRIHPLHAELLHCARAHKSGVSAAQLYTVARQMDADSTMQRLDRLRHRYSKAL